MKKICVLFFIIIIPVIFCGCSRVVTCKADELVMNTWHFENENNVSAELSFENNTAKLQICSDEEINTVISGQVLVSNNEIVITDTETKQNFIMTYELYGDKIILKHDDNELKMTKSTATNVNSDERH